MSTPAHASYSQLDSWLTCGERYYLQRIWGADSIPGWALIGGSTVHQVTEELDVASFSGSVSSGEENIPTRFAEVLDTIAEREAQRNNCLVSDFKASGRVSKAWPNKEDRDWWIQNGPGMVQSWINWKNSVPAWGIWITPDGLPAIELEMEVTFGDMTIKLAIDRIYEVAGELIVTDIKSGRAPKGDFQLGMYAAAVEQKYGVRPNFGTYWMARTGSTTSIDALDVYTQQYVDMTFRKFKIGRENGMYLPHPGDFCGSCGVRDFCTVKGTRAEEVPRPYFDLEVATS